MEFLILQTSSSATARLLMQPFGLSSHDTLEALCLESDSATRTIEKPAGHDSIPLCAVNRPAQALDALQSQLSLDCFNAATTLQDPASG